MSWRLRAARQKCSREKRRRHEEFGKRADGVHGRMGSVLFLFCERGATHRGFAARTRATEGIAEAGLEPSREQRQIEWQGRRGSESFFSSLVGRTRWRR